MTKVSRILKDFQRSGAVNALVGIHAAVDDRTFLTKAGHLVMMLGIEGVDYECLDSAQLDQIARGFERSLRACGEDVRLYQYLIKRDHAAVPVSRYDNPVVQQAIAARTAYLREKAHELYSLDISFALVYEGWRQGRDLRGRFNDYLRSPVRTVRQALSPKATRSHLEEELAQAREALANAVMNFVAQMPDAIGVRVLDTQQAYRFLRGLVNYAPHKIEGVRLTHDRYVDFWMCDSALECHSDHLRLDDSYVQVLTLKAPPSQTFAHLLRGLQEIGCNIVIASEWKREETFKIRRLIQTKRRHFFNAKHSILSYFPGSNPATPQDRLVDDSAVAHVADLGACLEELEVNGRHFGQFSMTIVLHHDDRSIVKQAAAECFKVFAAHDAQLTEERYNQLNAWAAVVPGNSAYNLRRVWLTDTNCADLSFLFTLRTGDTQNPHLGAEYLAVLETNHKTPYFLNLHYQDIAHSMILGATGSGKSFFLQFLLTHLQKYCPFTFIFDLGGSYENLTRHFEGAYLPVGLNHGRFTINPFSLSPDAENLQFLFSFVKVLVESNAYRMTNEDERDLYAQVENLYEIDREQRRLLTLANMLNRRLRQSLEKWVEGGPFASVFDNVDDTLTFSRMQAFDFEGMDRVPEVLEPLLFYVLHRANASIYDPAQATTLKVFVMDEAWRFLRHPTIQRYILEALKTWRKKNGAMILATQSSDDLLRSELLNVVVESCATKMFLANPDMDKKLYRGIFHLNETEADLIAGLIPKQQILVKRPDMAKVVNLNVDRKDYWLYTSNPYERERRRQAFEQFGFEEGLNRLAQSEPAQGGSPR
jgi:type IV secretion/conjugal transfer VirB4 family ATPase